MTARVISLARFRQRRDRAQRQARTLRADGSTLLLDGLRLTLEPKHARALAEGISDALDGRSWVAAAGFVIAPVGQRFRVMGWDIAADVTRGQLAMIGLQMVSERREAK